MTTAKELNSYADKALAIYNELELEIFRKIASYLKVNEDDTSVIDWQLNSQQALQNLNNDVIQLISERKEEISQEIKSAVKKAMDNVIEDTDRYFINDVTNNVLKPLKTADVLLNGYIKQTFRELDNFVNQTLISTNYGHGTVAQMYQEIIQKVTFLFTTGTLPLNKAIERTLLEWSHKGLQSAFVDKGGHTWSLERYVEMVMRSTMQRTYNETRTARMADYDCYTVLVTSKPKARPACAQCQGKVIDVRPISQADSGYPSAYDFGYGKASGHRGVNCGHDWIPFIDGVNINNMRQYDEEEAVKNYLIDQRRKQLERRIKQTQKDIAIAKELNSDKLSQLKAKLKKQYNLRNEFIDRHNLRL